VVFLGVTMSGGTLVPVPVSVCAVVVVHRLKLGQLCGVPGCDNVKRYTCARSGVSLCCCCAQIKVRAVVWCSWV